MANGQINYSSSTPAPIPGVNSVLWRDSPAESNSNSVSNSPSKGTWEDAAYTFDIDLTKVPHIQVDWDVHEQYNADFGYRLVDDDTGDVLVQAVYQTSTSGTYNEVETGDVSNYTGTVTVRHQSYRNGSNWDANPTDMQLNGLFLPKTTEDLA